MSFHEWGLGILISTIALCISPAVSGYVAPTKYLIVSNAVNGTIAYTKVSGSSAQSPMVTLISSGLTHPQGIAVDQKRQLLLVADSEYKKVFSYGLTQESDGSLKVDEQTPVMENVEARWVAVDGLGNVFASDETQNELLCVSAQKVLDGDTTAEVLYSSTAGSELTTGAVSAPGGVAVDNFYVYWVNKFSGDTVGTVMRDLEMVTSSTNGTSKNTSFMNLRREDGTLEVLANNLAKAYGVCLAIDNIFYTATANNVYAVKKLGGDPISMTDNLSSPRGCVWDGDDTIFVADRSAGGVYSFPGPHVSLAAANVTVSKVVDYENAFGVAIFSSAFRDGPLGALLLAVALAAPAWLFGVAGL